MCLETACYLEMQLLLCESLLGSRNRQEWSSGASEGPRARDACSQHGSDGTSGLGFEARAGALHVYDRNATSCFPELRLDVTVLV